MATRGIPDFSGIELGVPKADGGTDEWRSAVKKATGGDDLLRETHLDSTALFVEGYLDGWLPDGPITLD